MKALLSIDNSVGSIIKAGSHGHRFLSTEGQLLVISFAVAPISLQKSKIGIIVSSLQWLKEPETTGALSASFMSTE